MANLLEEQWMIHKHSIYSSFVAVEEANLLCFSSHFTLYSKQNVITKT